MYQVFPFTLLQLTAVHSANTGDANATVVANAAAIILNFFIINSPTYTLSVATVFIVVAHTFSSHLLSLCYSWGVIFFATISLF